MADYGTAVTTLLQRINGLAAGADAKGLVYLSKGVEALQGTVTLQAVADEGDAQVQRIRDEAQAAVGGVLVSDTDTTAGKLVDKLRRHDGGALNVTGGGGDETVRLTTADVNALGLGQHDICFPASALRAKDSDGAELTTITAATSGEVWDAMSFDPATAECASLKLPLPANVGGTAPEIALWAVAGSGTGDCVWAIEAAWIRPGLDTLEPGYGTPATVTQSLSADPAAIAFVSVTPGGTYTGGCLLAVRVSRAATDGADTLAADARLLAGVVRLTVNGGTAA